MKSLPYQVCSLRFSSHIEHIVSSGRISANRFLRKTAGLHFVINSKQSMACKITLYTSDFIKKSAYLIFVLFLPTWTYLISMGEVPQAYPQAFPRANASSVKYILKLWIVLWKTLFIPVQFICRCIHNKGTKTSL